MQRLKFAWNEKKNKENQRKHGISFEEAQTVFFDNNAIRYFDPEHSQDEDRFILVGISLRLRILVVCHCFRESESVIRLISARRATRKESKMYPGG